VLVKYRQIRVHTTQHRIICQKTGIFIATVVSNGNGNINLPREDVFSLLKPSGNSIYD
jgi:hypothetical protein